MFDIIFHSKSDCINASTYIGVTMAAVAMGTDIVGDNCFLYIAAGMAKGWP